MKQLRYTTFIAGALALVGAMGLGGCLMRPALPTEALVGADPRSAAIVWSANLADATGKLTVFSVTLTGGAPEYRAVLRIANQEHYLGALKGQLGAAPLQTVFFQLADTQYVVGRVQDSVPGSLAFVDLQRLEPDASRWSLATRRSEVKDRIFFMPLSGGDSQPWEQVERASVQSRESLATAVQGMGAQTSAWEASFEPPIDISPLFVIVR